MMSWNAAAARCEVNARSPARIANDVHDAAVGTFGNCEGSLMSLVIRLKEGTKNIVVMRYAALYYYLMWPLIAVIGAAQVFPWRHYITGACFLLLVLLGLPFRSAVIEVKRVMKTRQVLATGSKWSFSNPLRYEWDD